MYRLNETASRLLKKGYSVSSLLRLPYGYSEKDVSYLGYQKNKNLYVSFKRNSLKVTILVSYNIGFVIFIRTFRWLTHFSSMFHFYTP